MNPWTLSFHKTEQVRDTACKSHNYLKHKAQFDYVITFK